MNQLYKIGILVAIMLLVLLGFSKLGDRPLKPDLSDDADVATEVQVEGEVDEDGEDNNKEIIMNDVQEENTVVTLKTNRGDIKIELFTKDMPITAGNFLKLVKEDFYDETKFHRVINNFMIQAGDPNSKDDSKQGVWGTGGPGYAIEDEHVEGFSNVRGTLSMANSGPNSGGSQFFINLVDNINLDFNKEPMQSKHPVFGRVIDGLEVVDTIGAVATGVNDVPVEPVTIEDIIIE